MVGQEDGKTAGQKDGRQRCLARWGERTGHSHGANYLLRHSMVPQHEPTAQLMARCYSFAATHSPQHNSQHSPTAQPMAQPMA